MTSNNFNLHKDRIKQVREIIGYTDITDFARDCGVSRPTMFQGINDGLGGVKLVNGLTALVNSKGLKIKGFTGNVWFIKD